MLTIKSWSTIRHDTHLHCTDVEMWQERDACFGTDEMCGLVQVSGSQKNMISELKGMLLFVLFVFQYRGQDGENFPSQGS